MRTATVFAMAAVALLIVTPHVRANSSKFQYISPRPDAKYVSRGTTLAFRTKAAGTPSIPEISVSGSASGAHTGAWIIADDGRTVIFRPANEFAPGEHVTVGITIDGSTESYGFAVSSRTGAEQFVMPDCDCFDEDLAPMKHVGLAGPLAADGVSKPPGFPNFQITTNTGSAPGHVFITPGNWIAIMENDGTFCYFANRGTRCTDFEVSPSGNLTFMERDPAQPVPSVRAKGLVMDNTYTVTDEFVAGNGYATETDFHEFTQLPNGNVILVVYNSVPVDMSQVVQGGNPNAMVQGLILQELDPSHNVVFEWRSWDHFQITDTYQDVTAFFIDYVHCNAVDVDSDGNWLVSSRNMSEVTKIDRSTGDIIWRLGGKNNQFALTTGTFFTRQHDIRRLANGNVTVYDNGNDSSPQESRAVEYQLVETGSKTAAVVWQFYHPDGIFSPFTGSVRRLPNGNTFISWGSMQRQTELDALNNIVWESTGLGTYRAFRQVWSGAVAAIPTLWATTSGQHLTLHFVKFGDPNVARYRVYRGYSPNNGLPIGSTTGDSFVVHGFDSGETMYFHVTAVDDDGNEGPPSETFEITPGFGDDGTNLYASGADIHPKNLMTSSKGKYVTAYIELDGACGCSLEDIDLHSILLNGTVQAQSHPTAIGDHDGDGVPDLMVKFLRADVVDLASTLSQMRRSMVGFTVSGLMESGYFGDEDEITVAMKPYRPSEPLHSERAATNGIALHQNVPNPFNPTTVISFEVPATSLVDLGVFDLSGRRIRTLRHGTVEAGLVSVVWDGRDDAQRPVASGVYFYRLSDGRQVTTRKMLLLK